MRIFRKLAQLLDVNVAGVEDGDALVYDEGSGMWVPGSGGGGGGASDAEDVDFTPAGGLSSTNVQDALEELDTEKAAVSHTHAGEAITSGTVADARIASTIARDSEVTAAISALSSVYQAKDTTLDTYAGIDPSANVQSILSAADYAAIRTLLGLVIGTNVQAYDADLDTYAGISPSANVQSLLGAANYAAIRALLDLEAGTDFPSLSTFNDHSARHEDGGADEISLTGLSGAPADTVNKALIDAKGDLIVGTADNTVARLAAGTDGHVLTAASGEAAGVKWAAASGGASDPIATMFGTPDTAFEFDTSSLTGLTAIGTPDVQDANTSVPGCYFVQDNATGTAYCGRYLAPPSAPWTAIVKVAASTVRQDHNKAGMFIGEATPGAMDCLSFYNATRSIRLERLTNPTTFGSAPNATTWTSEVPCWFAIRCNSSSSFDYFASNDGICWMPVALARNPSITVASLGFGISSENGGGVSAAFDFLRIWNSAKTFLQP